MNVVIQRHTLRSLNLARTLVPAFVHTVDDKTGEVCKRVVRLLRVETAPVADNVFPRTLPAVFAIHWVVVVLLRRDVFNHQLKHRDSLGSQFILFLRLENLFQKVRVRYVELSLLVDLDTLNGLNVCTVDVRQVLTVEVLLHHFFLIFEFHYCYLY